jgi:aspartate aminotransferase-like enzyme
MNYNLHTYTPGPVKMFENTLRLGGMQTPYFRNKEFSDVILECEKNLLKIANAPKNSRVVFLTAAGTAGMESTVQNLLNSDDKVLVINGGGFGQRFVDICTTHNIVKIDCKIKNINLSDTSILDSYKDCSSLLINAHETSVGHLYDLEAVGKFAKKNEMLNIVDAISMFITDEIDMIKHNIDALIISSHKGLALPPGLSMVILSPKAINKINPKHQLYFDFNSYLNDGRRGQTPFTPAITIILQLQDRLRDVVNKGIGYSNKQAKDIAIYFRQNIEDLPLVLYSLYMPNAMTTLSPTDGKKAIEIVNILEKRYNCVVAPNGGELKDKIFRVSHMGAMTIEYTDILIDSLYDYYKIKRK